MLENHIRDFIKHCRASNLSEKTITWYKLNLQHFAQFAQDKPLTPETLQDYIIHLKSSEVRYEGHPKRHPKRSTLSNESLRGHIRTLRRFFKWMTSTGRIGSDPSIGLRAPRHHPVPRGITESDFQALLNAIDPESKFALRDRALLYLLRDTGCRASEIANIKKADVDLKRGNIIVRGKGSRERIAFISPPTQRILQEYLDSEENDYPELFRSRLGRFTRATLTQIIDRLKRRAGIKGKVNPHAFRHAFARDYLDAGGDLASLSQILGHSDLTTTMIYAKLSTNDLKRKHSKYSPIVRYKR